MMFSLGRGLVAKYMFILAQESRLHNPFKEVSLNQVLVQIRGLAQVHVIE